VWLVFGCSRRNIDGQTAACRRIVGTNRTIAAAGSCQAEGWPAAGIQPTGADRYLVRAADRLSLGVFSPGTGLWVGHDLLATLARLAHSRRVGKNLAGAARRTGAGRRNRLVEGGDRQLLGASAFWGAQTGPNPTDRGKNGSKRHVACDGRGTPLAIIHTAANVHDSQAAIPLIDAIPPTKRPGGGRRKRPDAAFADRAYDAEDKIRVPLRERGIQPFIAKRNTEHGSGLGVHRCVVEWVFSWLFKFRRLRVRYEKRDDIHTAFLTIGCLLICWNRLEGFC